MTTPQGILTIGDILAISSLDVTLLAGGAGLCREVLWAHSCEMSDPARWLGPHELLMTVGLCVPPDPDDQVIFIRTLDDGGLAGLIVGDHQETAPPLSDEMLTEANQRAFPVLLAAPHTPYAVVARHVAAANTSSQTLTVLKLSKLYHLAANADGAEQLVRDLATLLGVGIRVDDAPTGVSILEAQIPGGAREDDTARSYAQRGTHPTSLVITEHDRETLDGFLLVHLMKVLEVTVGRILHAAERRRETGEHAMRSLLNGLTPHTLDSLLAPHRATDGYLVVSFSTADAELVTRTAALRALPVVVGEGAAGPLALLPLGVVPEVRVMAEAGNVRFGASSAFTSYADVRMAADEAAQTLASALQGDRTWVDFVGSRVSVLSRSSREAEEITQGVLRGLLENSVSATNLRETLFAYLRHDRSWKDTSKELSIHRQTLSYRLKRIQEITGLNVSRSADLSALWVAYKAWESLQ
tara:strand:+ start:9474 stop:10883 length:1410 start_codon:yes stop_codon:yes gene_type:complete